MATALGAEGDLRREVTGLKSELESVRAEKEAYKSRLTATRKQSSADHTKITELEELRKRYEERERAQQVRMDEQAASWQRRCDELTLALEHERARGDMQRRGSLGSTLAAPVSPPGWGGSPGSPGGKDRGDRRSPQSRPLQDDVRTASTSTLSLPAAMQPQRSRTDSQLQLSRQVSRDSQVRQADQAAALEQVVSLVLQWRDQLAAGGNPDNARANADLWRRRHAGVAAGDNRDAAARLVDLFIELLDGQSSAGNQTPSPSRQDSRLVYPEQQDTESCCGWVCRCFGIRKRKRRTANRGRPSSVDGLRDHDSPGRAYDVDVHAAASTEVRV